MATLSPDSILNSMLRKEIGKKQLIGIATVLGVNNFRRAGHKNLAGCSQD